MKEIPRNAKLFLFASSSCFDTSALLVGLAERWTNGFSPVNNITPSFSMLKYHLGMNNRPIDMNMNKLIRKEKIV
jgi:hypothetical protein